MAKPRIPTETMMGDVTIPINFTEKQPKETAKPSPAPEPAGKPAPDPAPETPTDEKKPGRKPIDADKKKGSRLSVYLTANVYAHLAKIAEMNDDSLNKVASKAIALYCQKMCPEEDTPENNEE